MARWGDGLRCGVRVGRIGNTIAVATQSRGFGGRVLRRMSR
mgnify:CR=1 FL=1